MSDYYEEEEREETYEEFCERRAEEEYEARQIDRHFSEDKE